MIKLFTVFMLLAIVSTTNFGQMPQTQADKVRAAAAKYSSSNTTVEVEMLSSTRFKGKISGVSDETFNITSDNGQRSTVRYDEVAEIKKKGGIGKGVWIGIAAAAVGAAVLIGIIAERCRNEFGSC